MRSPTVVTETENESILVAAELIQWTPVSGAEGVAVREVAANTNCEVDRVFGAKRRVGRVGTDKDIRGGFGHKLQSGGTRDGQPEAERRVFGELKDADVRGLADVAVTGIEEQFGEISDISADDSIKAALEIRSADGMCFKERDGFVNGEIEVRTNSNADRSSFGF